MKGVGLITGATFFGTVAVEKLSNFHCSGFLSIIFTGIGFISYAAVGILFWLLALFLLAAGVAHFENAISKDFSPKWKQFIAFVFTVILTWLVLDGVRQFAQVIEKSLP